MNFEYDKVGNMLGWNDGTYSGIFVYDELNRKTSETVSYGEFSKEYKYSYYANSQKKSITYPDTSKDEYVYEKGRLSRIDVPGGSISFNKYNWNSIENIQLPGGSSRSFSYDGFTNLKSLSAKDTGSNIVLDNSYTRDNQGFITDKQTISENKNYGYNPLNNLTAINEQQYSYDDLGNRLTDPEGNTYAYNKMNQLLSVSSESSVVDFEYDLNGNLIKKITGDETTEYTYSINNRLSTVSGLQSSVSYSYDPFGRRLSKAVDDITTYYFYSDEGLIGEYDSEGTEIVSYAYQPESLWQTNPLYLKKDYKLYFYINNELGAPVQLMGVNGGVVWQGIYDCFGNCTIDESSEITNNLRLPGQYYDKETGLYYNCNRYYDPTISRYITKDPIGLMGGFNMYVYVSSNPVNYIDPLGLRHRHDPSKTFPILRGIFTGDMNASDEMYKAALKEFGNQFSDISSGKSSGGSFLFSNYEYINQDGCKWICHGVTTDLWGIGRNVIDFGKGQWPLTVSMGFTNHLSIGSSGGNLGITGGKGAGLPGLNASYRLTCKLLSTSKKDSNGCPCNKQKSPPCLWSQLTN